MLKKIAAAAVLILTAGSAYGFEEQFSGRFYFNERATSAEIETERYENSRSEFADFAAAFERAYAAVKGNNAELRTRGSLRNIFKDEKKNLELTSVLLSSLSLRNRLNMSDAEFFSYPGSDSFVIHPRGEKFDGARAFHVKK